MEFSFHIGPKLKWSLVGLGMTLLGVLIDLLPGKQPTLIGVATLLVLFGLMLVGLIVVIKVMEDLNQ